MTRRRSTAPQFRLERLARPQIAVLRALVAAAGRGVAPVLVGGAIRDASLGRPDADLDAAVPAGALRIARRVAERLAGTFVPLDVERGAARVLAAGVRLDLADFRAPTLEEDLRGRDYTVNALAVDVRRLVRDGRAPVLDPTGGLDDLAARRLRAPDPRVLTEDPLRAVRGVRFEAALGVRLTPATARAIRAVAPAVARVAAERVRDELLAMLDLPHSARAVRRLDGLGLLAVILPEVEAMRATSQPPPHRFSVLEHSLRALDGADILTERFGALTPFGDDLAAHARASLGAGFERRHALKLAAFLHDVAKPETARTVGGRLRFFEHDVIGATRAEAIGRRLRLPERVTGVVAALVRHHLRPMHLAAAGEVTRRARYRFFRDLGENTRDLLLLTLVDAAAVRGESPLRVWRRAALVRDLFAGWREEQVAARVPPLLRGGDVMARYGLPPGPRVGQLLERLREAQALGVVATRDEALAYLDSSLAGP